jgi:hypothetical protein
MSALLEQVKQADPERQANGVKGLIALGDGVGPPLLQRVQDRDPAANQPLFTVLDAVLGKQHAALLAREVQKPRPELKRYLMRRLCLFADPELAPVFTAARKDKDARTAFWASLALLAQQQRDALPDVMAFTKDNWPEVAATVAEVLTPARSQQVGEWLFEAMAKASPAEQMTGLRLARYVMVKSQTVILRSYLEAKDHTVMREAINAARVLHGEAPIENLSVFKAIELRNHWMKQL